MSDYEIKKVLAVDNNLSLKECEKIIVSGEYCLGILDENREIQSFLLYDDLLNALKFDIKNCPVNIIATQADIIDIGVNITNIAEIKKHLSPGLNKGIFLGKDRKNIKELFLKKDSFDLKEEKQLLQEYEGNISDNIKQALELCTMAADKISLPVFLIGGVVRDIIVGQKCFDVDITVEENAIEFSRFLRKEYPKITKIKEIHHDFKTSKMLFHIDNKIIEIDIASTRKEFYRYPSSLPTINEIGCSIIEDIKRRDFTINSMALSLNKKTFCRLIDPFNGYRDLIDKKLKILHPLSYVDDPTRIIRGLKFGVRLDLDYDTATQKLQQACLNSSLFNGVGGERIKSEIKQTFNLNKAEAFYKFIAEKIYFLIDDKMLIPPDSHKFACKCEKLIDENKESVSSNNLIWLIYFGSLIAQSSSDQIINISAKLYLSGLETEILTGAKSILKKTQLIKEASTRFEVYEILEGYFSESVLISLINSEGKDVIDKISLFLKDLQNIKIFTTGKNLIEAGLIPGPVFGEILRELLQAKINQEIFTENDEADYIRKFCANRSRN